MKRLILTIAIALCIPTAFASITSLTWPPPAGFQAIYPPVGNRVTDCGGSITVGGTPQRIITAAQFTQGFIIEIGANDSNTNPFYFSDSSINPGSGVAGSLSLNPSTATTSGGSFTTPNNYPVQADVWANSASNGDKFKCRVW